MRTPLSSAQLKTAAFALFCIAVSGCGKKAASFSSKPSQPVRSAVPSGHTFDFDNGFVGTDLTHGRGAARLEVVRSWRGSSTLNTHFGRGWSDPNVVRIGLVTKDIVLIWRGGVGSDTAHRTGEKSFANNDREPIQQNESGWMMTKRDGSVLTFGTDGRLVSDKPAAGAARKYEYDKNGRITSAGTSAENTLRYVYDGTGRVTRIDGPEKLRLDYRYDDKGRLISAISSRKVHVDYHYGDDGGLVGAVDQFGNGLDLATATMRVLPVEKSASPALPAGSQAKYAFDQNGRIKGKNDGGDEASYQFDQEGRLTSISSKEGRASCKYDAFGRIAEMQNADGTSSRFEYNDLDQPTLIANSDGTSEKRRYNDQGVLTRIEHSPTDWEEMSYDTSGRVEVRRRPPAIEERYTYGEGDRVSRIHYASGAEVSFEYGPDGKLLNQSWNTGESRQWRYDTNGTLVESVDENGLRTSYRYDEKGRLTSSEDAVHGRKVYRYPGANVVSVNVPDIGETITESSAWGMPLMVKGPGGRTTVFRYDPAGRLQHLILPSGFAWRYEHDKRDKLAAIFSPSGGQTSLRRSPAGSLEQIARGPVAWRRYQYDGKGRLEREFSPAGTAATYKYDGKGRRSEIELAGSRVSYTFDDKGLHSGLKGPDYKVDDYLNVDGTLARRTYGGAKLELKLPLDAQGRPAGAELNQLKSKYAYNARGLVERIELPGGNAITISRDDAGRETAFEFGAAMRTKISYDQANRITGIDARDSSGKQIYNGRYSYDPAGNLATAVVGTAQRKFEYDRDNQLTKVSDGKTTHSFEHDVDGNISAMPIRGQARRFILDNLGRPREHGATGFSWDAAGNLARTESAHAKIENQFDAADRLVRRTDGKQTWSFGYLPNGDRLWKQNATRKSWYAFLPDRLAGFKDETGVDWLLVSLPGTDRPLALCGSNGKTLFIVSDRLSSARRFVDSSGATVASVDYSAFGSVEAESGSAPIGIFAGMLRDDTGLMYARQRYYDPNIGRFISIDPLIGTPGVPSSHNAYAYAANNPLRYRDPLGTSFTFDVETYWYRPDMKQHIYEALSAPEQAAVRANYEAAEAARRAVQNPTSTAAQVQEASQALARHEAELQRIRDIGVVRHQHKMATIADLERYAEQGVYSAEGARRNQEMIERSAEKLKQMGLDPMEPYSESGKERMAQRAAEKAAAQEAVDAAAARDARAGGAFERGTKTGVPNASVDGAGTGTKPVKVPSVEDAAGTKPVKVPSVEDAASGTKPVKVPPVEDAGAAGQGDLASRAREKLERGLKNNEAVNITKEEMEAFQAEEAARRAANAGKAGGVATEGASTAGKAGELAYDAKTGTWKPVSSAGRAAGDIALEGAGQRWLGPKILETGGKILQVAHPVLQVMTAIDVARLGKAAADNYIDFLNAPFAKEQKDKQEAKWMADDLKKRMAELAASDPNSIILGDGRKFDPNNPADMDEIMRNLGQNLYFGRKPFDNIFKYIPKLDVNVLPKTYMGAAPGDTAQEFSLTSARKLLQEGYQVEKKVKDAAAELTRQESEAQTQLQKAATVAGVRGVVESDYTKVLEKVGDVKQKSAALQGQTKAMEAADTEFRAAMSKCEETANKICDYANRVAGASESDIANWRKEAINELGSASNVLNNAQAKVDGIDAAIQALNAAIGVLDGFKASLTIYQMGGAMAEKANISPDGALDAAKAAAAKADTERTNLTTVLGELRGIVGKITVLVSPYASADMEAAAIQAAAKGLGGGISEPGTFNFGLLLSAALPVANAAISNQKAVEKTLGNLDLDSIINSAREVANSAQTAFSNASAMAAGPERYAPLQRASQCFGAIKPATQTAEASPSPSASPGESPSPTVVAALSPTPPLVASPSPAVGVSPTPAVASSPPGPSPSEPAIAEENPSQSGVDNEGKTVRVPDLSVFDGLVEMKAAATQVGLVPAIAATNATPPPGSTRLFAGQDPAPGETATRGSTLQILVYQKVAESQSSSGPSSPAGGNVATNPGKIPNLIGLTLDQAVNRLTNNMRIGSDEAGSSPPSPSLAMTIYSQSPAPNTKVDPTRPVAISVKRYGSAQAAPPKTAERFDGTYVGSYSGNDRGRVRFTVSGGSIEISSPGSGSGEVSASGRANISGSGADGDSSYSFTGTFSVDADGKATASGRWSGQQQGFTGSGSWRASRP